MLQKSCLLVIDNNAIKACVHTAFEQFGFRIKEETNCQEALSAFNEERADVVVIDCYNNVTQKISFIQALRQTDFGSYPYILLCTDNPSNIERNISATLIGADDYVTKPFSITNFSKKMERIIIA